jgi:Sulfotransferase domain
MYSFRQRPDTVVVDEPLYGHYLQSTGAEHPGASEVLDAMDNDGERVVREVILGPCERHIHFFKNMAHHLPGLDPGFLDSITNVLLIRDPTEMLPSLARQLSSPTLRDTGLREQNVILDSILARGKKPIVLDARELLLDPPGVMRLTCANLGIPFEDAMLSWQAGPKPEDGVWARYWYHNVHASTGFAPYSPPKDPFPPRLERLLEECLPYYERIRSYAITA